MDIGNGANSEMASLTFNHTLTAKAKIAMTPILKGANALALPSNGKVR